MLANPEIRLRKITILFDLFAIIAIMWQLSPNDEILLRNEYKKMVAQCGGNLVDGFCSGAVANVASRGESLITDAVIERYVDAYLAHGYCLMSAGLDVPDPPLRSELIAAATARRNIDNPYLGWWFGQQNLDIWSFIELPNFGKVVRNFKVDRYVPSNWFGECPFPFIFDYVTFLDAREGAATLTENDRVGRHGA